jgi:D-alanyl-D-alanine carboxypeptidase/D-alanyl-D-alanine-endopeptidase (penicillin-binding protein 4)
MIAWGGPALFLALASAHAAPSKGDREALKKALADVIARTPLKSARISIQVQSLDDGAVIFAQNPDDLLNPASNVKLFTAAAALVKLGSEYRFETEFLTEGEVAGGKARTLFVRGKGDPSITTERLFNIASELYHAGLREVQGDLVIDESWFDAERLAPGFDQENSDRAYMAPTGAVSLNWNVVGVYLRPGPHPGAKASVEVEPPSDFFSVESTVATGSRYRRRFSVSLESAGERVKVLARGSVPSERGALSVWKKVDRPPLYFAQTLKRLLADRGVKIKGRVRVGIAPQQARILHLAQSDTLDLILKRLNKISSNFVAEQLIKTLAAENKGVPASIHKGIEVVEEFLETEVGIPRGSYVMKNGSGLNDTNRFSAAQISRLLRLMYERFPLAPEYLSSMGIAGKDGTLRYRFEGSDAVGRLRGKTGTLENVSTLSGYVQAVGGEKFTFAMLVNDFSGRSGPIVQGLDALGAAVAASGSVQGPSKAVTAIMTQESIVGPLEEATSRVRTYLTLGKQGDKRNIPFLRTAWRSEKDPAVRAVLADSLYQSNPEDYLGARALLDSFSAADAVYGRLLKLAKVLGVEVPGFSSIVELAAQGNAEALARLIELARAAQGDAAAPGELAEALVEVAHTAPDELLIALRAAPPTDRDAATTLLVRGLAKAADAEHPFWPALRKLMGSVDPNMAAFAKELEAAMSQKIAQEKAPAVPPASSSVPNAAPAPAAQQNAPRPGG